MTGWIIFAVFAIGYLITWRRVCWVFLQEVTGGYAIDGMDITMSIMIGSICNIFWPAILVALTVRAFYHSRDMDTVAMLTPRHVRKAKELEQRERNIRSLERELGIGVK